MSKWHGFAEQNHNCKNSTEARELEKFPVSGVNLDAMLSPST